MVREFCAHWRSRCVFLTFTSASIAPDTSCVCVYPCVYLCVCVCMCVCVCVPDLSACTPSMVRLHPKSPMCAQTSPGIGCRPRSSVVSTSWFLYSSFLVARARLSQSISVCLSVCTHLSFQDVVTREGSHCYGKVELPWERNLCDPPVFTTSRKSEGHYIMEKLGCPEKETCVPPFPGCNIMEKCEGHNVVEKLAALTFESLPQSLPNFLGEVHGWINWMSSILACVGPLVWPPSWIWQKIHFGPSWAQWK